MDHSNYITGSIHSRQPVSSPKGDASGYPTGRSEGAGQMHSVSSGMCNTNFSKVGSVPTDQNGNLTLS